MEKRDKFIITGLGNPGEEYQETRHNIGFMVLDALVDKSSWIKSGEGNALFAQGFIGDEEVVFLKPQTFMNNSGVSVKYFLEKENISPENLVVIHDDLDLPLGKIKVSYDRSSAGHNGIKSIMEKVEAKNFGRIRIGIAPTDEAGNIRKSDDTESFVLKNFSSLEIERIKLEGILNCLAVYIGEGREKAMNEWN